MSEEPLRPLQNQRILVTRTREQASVLCERLRALGAEPVELPTIRIVPPADWQQLDQVLQLLYAPDATRYDWVVFTSANGVNICMERVRSLGYEPGALQGARVATIGPATAAALQRYGITADLVPDEYIAESVAQALMADAQRQGKTLAGQRILLARAAEARKVLVTELREAGAHVDEVPAYYTLPVTRDDEQGRTVWRFLQEHTLDILTFTSSSTVRNFVAWLKEFGQGNNDPLALVTPEHCVIACIGPITAQTARDLGLQVTIEATEYTIDGLINAIIAYVTNKENNRYDDRTDSSVFH